jgi:hypothetical protein
LKTRTITATFAALATAALIGAGTATPAAAFKACQVTDTGGVDDKGSTALSTDIFIVVISII